MSRFLAESDIEAAAIEWLTAVKPYHYRHGADLHRPLTKVVLEDVFAAFLQKKYKHVPSKILAEVQQEFLYNKGADIHYRNHHFHTKELSINKSYIV